MPSVQSWFHTNLIICDLYWPLDRENAILDTSLQSRITSQLCNLLYLFSFLLLFPVWIYRIWQKIASLCDPQVFSSLSFHSLVSCSYVSVYNAQNHFFLLWRSLILMFFILANLPRVLFWWYFALSMTAFCSSSFSFYENYLVFQVCLQCPLRSSSKFM